MKPQEPEQRGVPCRASSIIGRRCVVLGLLGCLAACEQSPPRAAERKVPLTALSAVAPGITPFPVERVALIREGHQLRAVSLVCTHQTCILTPAAGGASVAFTCPCHGAAFASDGAVLRGPATLPLPFHPLSLREDGVLVVDLAAVVPASWSLSIAR